MKLSKTAALIALSTLALNAHADMGDTLISSEASAQSPYIYPSQDTVDARKLHPGALVLLEPSAPMSMTVVDLGIYSGAIDEGNRTKQQMMISTGRIFIWDTQHYMPCKVLSIGAYGICLLKNPNGQEAYTSAAFLHRALLANPPAGFTRAGSRSNEKDK